MNEKGGMVGETRRIPPHDDRSDRHYPGWDLLWVIPMGNLDEPYFTFTFNAEGYVPLEIDLWVLYQVEGSSVKMKEYGVSGIEIEMGLNERVYRLKPSK